MRSIFFLSFVFGMLPFSAHAQNSKSEPSQWKPLSLPPAVIDFKNIAVAKTSADNSGIMFLIPQLNEEVRTRVVPKISMVAETRQRTVTRNGKQVTEEYTIQIPITESIEEAYSVQILGDVDRVTLPLDQLRAWRLDGTAIKQSEFAATFAKPTHVFAAPMKPSETPDKVEPYFSSMLRSDAIIVGFAPEALAKARTESKSNKN